MSLLGVCLAGASLAAPGAAAAQQAGSAGGAAPLNTLTPEERAAGWRLLFDGKTTAGWRGWKMDSMPSGWQVVDGTLKRVKPAADIITKEKFRNFELSLEWNIAKNGNSGIFYRASEDDNAIYWSAPEMQVLRSEEHTSELQSQSNLVCRLLLENKHDELRHPECACDRRDRAAGPVQVPPVGAGDRAAAPGHHGEEILLPRGPQARARSARGRLP